MSDQTPEEAVAALMAAVRTLANQAQTCGEDNQGAHDWQKCQYGVRDIAAVRAAVRQVRLAELRAARSIVSNYVARATLLDKYIAAIEREDA